MSYLLDTNVISELARPKPSSSVIKWIENAPNESLHLSTLTLGEIRKGVEQLTDNKRKEKLRIWLEQDLLDWFAHRILIIDNHVADRWGRLQAELKRPLAVVDSLIAATALTHDLRVVTRNTRDFQFPGLQVICPWD